MTENIVEWDNGTYSVRRKHWWGSEYLDLTNMVIPMWWTKSSKWFYDCIGTKELCIEKSKNRGLCTKIKSIIQ